MKIISLICFMLFCGSVWSSEYCKNRAQMAVDVRAYYENLADVEAALVVKSADLELLTGQNLINAKYEIDKLRIFGKIVFLHSSGAKGAKLFKVTYDRCVIQEKANNARNELIAKKAAIEAPLELERLERYKLHQEQMLRINAEADKLRHEEMLRINAEADKLRQEQMQYIKDVADKLRSSPPSARYAGKIIESIQSNVIFQDPSARKSWVVVLVKISSDGLIISRRMIESSGNNSWNEAVLRAIDKMKSVPTDTNGRIPEVLLKDGLEIKVTF